MSGASVPTTSWGATMRGSFAASTSKRPAELRVPPAGPRVGESREVQVARVDEGGFAAQAAQAHGRVAARLHEGADARVHVGTLVLPPEDLGPVVEARGPAGLADDLGARLALHALDVRRAAGVEPGVVGGYGPAVLSHADHARPSGRRWRWRPRRPAATRPSPRTPRRSRTPSAPAARGPPRPRRAPGASGPKDGTPRPGTGRRRRRGPPSRPGCRCRRPTQQRVAPPLMRRPPPASGPGPSSPRRRPPRLLDRPRARDDPLERHEAGPDELQGASGTGPGSGAWCP